MEKRLVKRQVRSNVASLSGDGLQVRVGIPSKGGALIAEAVNSGYPIMVSAAAFYRAGSLRAISEIGLGEIHHADVALDSAGFTAMQGWARKGPQPGMAGIYPWTLQAYTDVVASLGSSCSFWSQPDFCCEPAVAADRVERLRRVELTAMALSYSLQETHLREVLAERQFAGVRDRARRRRLVIDNSIRPPIPVLQGYEADDYRYSAELLQQAWEPWRGHYLCQMVGLGSVCRRDVHDRRHGILAILRAVEPILPPGTKLHLFGVKGAALRYLAEHPLVASADSMAWDFGARAKAARARTPNRMAGRIEHMHSWMRRHRPEVSRQRDLFRVSS